MNQPQVQRERTFAPQLGWVTDVESGALRVASSLPSRGDGSGLHYVDRGVRHPQVLIVRVARALGYHLVVVALDAGRRHGSDDVDVVGVRALAVHLPRGKPRAGRVRDRHRDLVVCDLGPHNRAVASLQVVLAPVWFLGAADGLPRRRRLLVRDRDHALRLSSHGHRFELLPARVLVAADTATEPKTV